MTDEKEIQAPKSMPRGQVSHAQFCAALMQTGECTRVEYNSTAELKTILDNAKIAWINYLVDDLKIKGDEVATSLGFTGGLVGKLLEGTGYSEYIDNDVELALLVPAVTVKNLEVQVYPLIVLMRKGLILTMAGTEVIRLVRFSRYADTFLRKIPTNVLWQDALTLALIRILDENNDRNFDHLREIESQADELHKDLMDPKTPRNKIGPAIYNMKHALIVYMNALWGTLDVVNSLRYGDAEVITDDEKIIERITMLQSDVNQQIGLSEHMSEVLASGLEVLQTIYNNQLQMLNNRLAWLATWMAVIGTAVLVPNTLATIYGTPLGDDISHEFMLYSLTIGTLVSGAVVFAVLKLKRWMPKNEEW
ncbi:MAG: CorA family divalent cation transporter [Candidatus Altiarchaeia archaeon]